MSELYNTSSELRFQEAKENGVVAGESILVTGGTPGVEGKTNYLQLLEVK